jgi:hypothetical protein
MLILGLFFLVVSCNPPRQNDAKKFDVKMNKFERSIKKVDKTIRMMDNMDARILEVKKQRDAGRISDKEAQRRIDAINKTLGREVAKSAKKTPVYDLPVWAKNLGITLPEGLTLDQDFSQITSENNPSEGFNSVTLVYRGNYMKAMQQASIIAGRARIPLTDEYKTAFEMKEKYGDEIIKGAVYMNFKLGASQNPRYTVAISVDESGTLTISVADSKKMKEQLETSKIQ